MAPLLVTAIMLPQFLQFYYPITHILMADLDQHFSNAFINASWHFLFPFLSGREGDIDKYHILWSDFLGDPMRSHEFHIDGNKFATLATTFAKYLFQPSM